MYGTVRYGTVPVLLTRGIISGGGGTFFSTESRPKAPGDVFSIVLCGPNEHKDYLSSARGNSSLRPKFPLKESYGKW